MKIPIHTIEDLRKVFEKEGYSEDEIREGFYNANPKLERPNERVENTVRKIMDNQSESQGDCLS